MARLDPIFKQICLVAACAWTCAYAPGQLALAQRAGGHAGVGPHIRGGQYVSASHVSASVEVAQPTSQTTPPARRPRARPIHFPGPRFPFFGGGLGLGFSSLGGLSCGFLWGWGYDCGALPLSDYRSGDDRDVPGADDGEAQQSEPLLYEYDYPPAPARAYLSGTQSPPPTRLYLRDGTMYDATDYWVVNDQFHFTTQYGDGTQAVEHVMVFDQLDTQRTIDVNAQQAIEFRLRNQPLEAPAPQLPRQP